MNLSWILLALALIAPDDQQPSTPKPPSSPFTVEVEFDCPAVAGARDCCSAATNATEKTSSCSKDAPALAGTLPMNLPKVAALRRRTPKDEDKESWPMTLREAIYLALDNSEIVRVIARCPKPPTANCFAPFEPTENYVGPIVISRLNAGVDAWRFKAEVLALVRSVEQQYWSLAQQHVQLWSSEKAVELARETSHARRPS